MEDVMSAVKTFEASDLFKLLKAVASEAEKKSKSAAKAAPKATAAKKAGSMPKGAIPPQLKKPRAWVEFTLKNALENGWEAFTIIQKKKDKETNTITEEQIEMPGSTLHNGAHIFEDSITEKTPDGRQLIHKEAMSLSKQRKESGHATYVEFEASYVDETTDDDKSVTSSTSSKKIVVKKTAAEKEAEAAAKKAEKEAEKVAKKAEKEAEKEAKKAEKEAEKAAAKAAKEAEKAAAKVDKKPAVKAPVPAAAVKKVAAAKPAAEPVVEKPVAVKKKAVAKPADEIPNDGMVHPWTYKAKKYLRNSDGETWTVGADGGVGEWAGMYDSKSDKLDTSAPEPVFEDDE
jgi:membrane protein involved in colicin uptake